ncbi:hypothetical protein SCLARK_00867 [Spiroplasma clarkii]|uniref:hypothetical protein n=1 Tax=Spiroplasma clarkii TaxID=2139 RepID=UPI000B572BBC|nr:hypothetical protein [Spiroplasma clarkii]ARU91480.1 hypothetical protein SCLARK_00867 [Spiroplasma clarkii]
MQRREIHEEAFAHMSCIAEDMPEHNFRMSHPLFEINLFIRTKWVGEFETTININYNQPIYIEAEDLNEIIENEEINGRLNNYKIELNLFLHFIKLDHINEWFKNILLIVLPTINRMLVLSPEKKKLNIN